MQEKIVLLILKRKTKLPKTSQHIALEPVRLRGQTGTLKINGKTRMQEAERAAGDAAQPPNSWCPRLAPETRVCPRLPPTCAREAAAAQDG